MSDLGELGLSSYEAKVYRALLGLGPASAAEISAASEVPRGRIYDVLNGLSAREIVTSLEGKDPTQYVPADPEEAVDILLAERERDLAAQRDHYEDIATSVTDDLAPVVPAESRFWPAGLGSDAAVSLIDQQFAVAEDRIISVMDAPYAAVDVETYWREIEAIDEHMRGELDLRVLVSQRLLDRVPTALRGEMLEDPDSVATRVAEDLHYTLDVVDRETVFVHVANPFQAGDRLGVVGVRDEAFARRVGRAFEDAWEAAATV
jgi:sugar-specific transcriptional regulator TrmB